MSQVQLRQMPTTHHSMAGVWFPTGYHGHFRAKSRADLSNQFRQLARPHPPRKFLTRQNSEASSHIFSQHDNRFKFENDPLVRCTQAGFGRRRSQASARGEFDPFFIGWLPENTDRKKFVETTKTTSYTNDYSGPSAVSQLLPDIQSLSSSPPSEVSVYSSVYNHGQPDSEQAKQIRQETFQRYATTQTRRLQLQQNERSSNVASCLVWNDAGGKEKLKTKEDKVKNSSIKSHHSFHVMPPIHQPKLRHSESMESIRSIEQPYSDTHAFEDRYDFAAGSSLRLASSLGQTRTNSVECLISKYM